MFTRIISALSMVLLCFMATGCATQVAVLQGFEPSDNNAGLTIVDARPAAEKTSEHLSRLITSCDYGIDRLGDEATQPAKMALLQHDLVRLLGDRAKGMTISVSHYTVHINKSRQLRKSVFRPNEGLIKDLMEPIGKDCPREKMTGGWYTASEVSTPHSPVIIEITANVDGKAHAVRTVYSPPEMFGIIQAPAAARMIFQAIRQANDALADRIKADSPT